MRRTERIVESRTSILSLSGEEAASLSAAGRRLASDRAWFGDAAPEDRSVIRCTPVDAGRWAVRVQDAVGVVSVGELQLVVEPKIPVEHLLYLFSQALQVPRLDDQLATADTASALWELVARWFVRSTLSVVRRDLSRDYHPMREVLPSVRGHVEHLPTARAYYSGRIELHCAFDEFVPNTPLNRLLRAAAREVSRSRLLSSDVRKEAARLLMRLEDIDDLQPGDLAATVDRRTWYYRHATILAKHILRCVGRTIADGTSTAWTFLVRTPELVEEGVRQILSSQLPHLRISKKTASIVGSTFGVHPDLVFGQGWAVADVKYKLLNDDWNRADLYEVVAFAAAFRTTEAALLNFAPQLLAPRVVALGATNVTQLTWNHGLAPAAAASELCASVLEWTMLIERRRLTDVGHRLAYG